MYKLTNTVQQNNNTALPPCI